MGLSAHFAVFKDSVREFIRDDCPSMAAALSYYTVFALPPLLILLLLLLGAFLDPRDVQGAIEGQIRGLMGPAGGEQVRSIIRTAEHPGSDGLWAGLVGGGALLLGATGVFGQLQSALNRTWGVEPDPARGGIRNFILKRILSFGMVLGLAFLLLVSLVVTAMISAFGDVLARRLPGALSAPVLEGVNLLVSFVVIALLFAAMFKVLPDATIAWRDALVGAVVTALLFVVGKFLVGFYLGQSNPGEAFGAAGSLALMLAWIYYTSMIVLFGSEYTQLWAERRGQGLEPEKGAVRTVRQKHRLRHHQAE